MASQDRGPFTHIIARLIREGKRFSFFQAIRLLRMTFRSNDASSYPKDSEKGGIRISPHLSMGFPPSDIVGIEEDSQGKSSIYHIKAAFFGLYGVSSPLPHWYTKELIDDEKEGFTAAREFLDIINNHLYWLLYRAFNKYRLFLHIAEEQDPDYVNILFSLMGLREMGHRNSIPAPYSLLRYAGLFAHASRSALGLKTMLRDAFADIPFDILPCQSRIIRIPPDQQMSLGISGISLGEDAFLGDEMEDRTSAFRINIGPLTQKQYYSMLPGTENHRKLTLLTQLYIADQLDYSIDIFLPEREICNTALGSPQWSSLGFDTWMLQGEDSYKAHITFDPSESLDYASPSEKERMA